ncbi:hypothetical protein C9374_004031 [Naegleria lovaniensis]|uniref:MHD domain-containing protein n=1 Tax=Naegleria lovaniensis TaxID=51637 RepID=A0AA88KSL4_NAELO|nr:uncharacterized protein C9374_004031 [Naegleria lovaniensis]KAG2394267.1 hypothetical protein C9374_004031 [Naegleria lovaniensis]
MTEYGILPSSIQYASPMDGLLNSALSLRGVWILDEQRQKILFSRRFPTVEKRALELIRAQQHIGTDENQSIMLSSSSAQPFVKSLAHHLSASISDFGDGFLVEYFSLAKKQYETLAASRSGLSMHAQLFKHSSVHPPKIQSILETVENENHESLWKVFLKLMEENYAMFSMDTKFVEKYHLEEQIMLSSSMGSDSISAEDEDLAILLPLEVSTSLNTQNSLTVKSQSVDRIKSPTNKKGLKSPSGKKHNSSARGFSTKPNNNSPNHINLFGNSGNATSLQTAESDKNVPPHIFPFVSIVVGGVTFVALPLIVPNASTTTPESFIDFSKLENTLEYPSISGAFSFLQDLSSNFFLANQKHQKSSEVTNYMNMYISQCAPFGRPIDSAPSNVHLLLTKPFPIDDPELSSLRRPSWKAHSLKFDQQRIHFIIRENILSAQFDKKDIPDEISCFGSILCSAEIDGFSDVTVSLSELRNTRHISVHYCCRDHPDEMSNPGCEYASLSFSPPSGAFVLCKYNIENVNKPPVRGYYQMRELADNKVEFLLQLGIDSVDSQFEYCNVIIPFPNRTEVTDISYQAVQGQLTKGKGKNNLVWTIGNKWKTKELSLSGTLTFNQTSSSDTMAIVKDVSDPFFVNKNSLVRLQYKLLNMSLSGVIIDPKTVSLNSSLKLEAVTIKREIVAEDCVIYNSRGDVRHVQ